MSSDRLLTPGETCWRVERADQLACIIDGADYFYQCKAALLQAQRRVLLIGWDFDTRMTFERGGKTLPGPNQLGTFLRWLVRVRPNLDIYLLRSNLRLLPAFEGMWGDFTPVALLNWLTRDRLQFAIDGAHPTGAVHHQKIVVIDDVMAFCGGIDLTHGRWDTREHLQNNEFRVESGSTYGPRHEAAFAVSGPAARALGDQARERWRTATGEYVAQVVVDHRFWPDGLEPLMRNVDVGIMRTMPEMDNHSEVREVEALNLAAIAAARHTIYLENQYLASRTLAFALTRRLREPDGPEIVIVIPRSSESRLEEQAMDSARYRLLHELWQADQHQRLAVYWPVTDEDMPIYVHSKIMVIDDRLLRIGSSNLNNRSMGFDSECDVAVEADPAAAKHDELRQTITSVRNHLVCEHLGVSADEFGDALQRRDSFLQAVETLRGEGRTLRRFTEETIAGEASMLAENDLMDPDHVPKSVGRSVQRWIERLSDFAPKTRPPKGG